MSHRRFTVSFLDLFVFGALGPRLSEAAEDGGLLGADRRCLNGRLHPGSLALSILGGPDQSPVSCQPARVAVKPGKGRFSSGHAMVCYVVLTRTG